MMFRWLRSQKQKSLAETIFDLIDAYGAVLEHTAKSIAVDVSKLPAPKDKLLVALKTGWLMAKDETLRLSFECAWIGLSYFQEGVGDHDIVLVTPDEALTDSGLLALADISKWGTIVSEEATQRLAEINTFKAKNSH